MPAQRISIDLSKLARRWKEEGKHLSTASSTTNQRKADVTGDGHNRIVMMMTMHMRKKRNHPNSAWQKRVKLHSSNRIAHKRGLLWCKMSLPRQAG